MEDSQDILETPGTLKLISFHPQWAYTLVVHKVYYLRIHLIGCIEQKKKEIQFNNLAWGENV